MSVHACFQLLSASHMDVLLSRRAVAEAAADEQPFWLQPAPLRQAARDVHVCT